MGKTNKIQNQITVTKPFLPDLAEFMPYLDSIWENKWLTNNGPLHAQLEKELADYLNVEFISLYANGTLALISAFQALEIKGEVITTPYSFVATSHSLWWNNIKPVFVDIDSTTLNIDVSKIESVITERTTAILPVHIYGNPCNVEQMEQIAQKYGLKVIYDAAHAFGVKVNNKSILHYGDLSVLSFHATKVFSTVEGGAIVCHSKEMKHHLDNLRNFGFRGETKVEEPGINAKMSELHAAFGLLQLKYLDGLIKNRKEQYFYYFNSLKEIKGISFVDIIDENSHPFNYVPILIDELNFGFNRDFLYEYLKKNNVLTRRYFYPLISDFEPYNSLPSSTAENLRNAVAVSKSILCLPVYNDLSINEIKYIVKLIVRLHRMKINQ